MAWRIPTRATRHATGLKRRAPASEPRGALDLDRHAGAVVGHRAGQTHATGERVNEGPETDALNQTFDPDVEPHRVHGERLIA